MKTMKENALGTWIALLSVLLCAAGMVSYYVLSQDGEKSPTVVYLLSALAIATQAAVMFFNRTRAGRFYNTASLAAAVLTALALEQMLLGRVEWLGGLAAHNASLAPMHTAFPVTVALYGAAVVMCVAAAFCKQIKD